MTSGLVTNEQIVNEELTLSVDQTRNLLCILTSETGPQYFSKNIVPGRPYAIQTLAQEAHFYEVAQSDSRFEPLGPILPKCLHYDPRNHVLVIEYYEDSDNLSRYYSHHHELNPVLAKRFGEALARCHTTTHLNHLSEQPAFQEQLPWVISVTEDGPPTGLQTLSGGNAQLIALIQQNPEIAKGFAVLRDSWKTSCLIHGDMKWDNCLLFPRDAPDTEKQIKIVDWEIVGYGDPMWDFGSFIHSYLIMWILTLDTIDSQANSGLEGINETLWKMQPSIKEFCDSYLAHNSQVSEQDFLKAFQFCAARLVQSAFEMLLQSQEIYPAARIALDLSAQIFADTATTRKTLLGF